MRVGELVVRLEKLQRENKAMRFVLMRIGRETRMRPTLTDQTAKVLDFIRDEVSRTGEFPSVNAIASHMNWSSKSNVNSTLHRLARRGDLIRNEAVRYGERYSLKSPPPRKPADEEGPPRKRGTAQEAAALAAKKKIPLAQAIKEVGLV